jgi:hypothetical protein
MPPPVLPPFVLLPPLAPAPALPLVLAPALPPLALPPVLELPAAPAPADAADVPPLVITDEPLLLEPPLPELAPWGAPEHAMSAALTPKVKHDAVRRSSSFRM